MEAFCRGCLTKYDPVELVQYNEKNRRLFVYSTGLQVKRTDSFTFQLCKDCCINMKMACNFKKNCRTSDKKLRSYLDLKESGECVEFTTFLKNNDDGLKIRLPLNIGNSTPAHNKNRDDDNESTCTSIQNFMTDILQVDDIPDSEARIIREVIEEEADISEDSLDSHWLQDEVSMDSDFRLDFSFSPFSAPGSVNNDNKYNNDSNDNNDNNVNNDNNDNEYIPKTLINQLEDKKLDKDDEAKIIDNIEDNGDQIFTTKPVYNLNESQFENGFSFNLKLDDKKCIIDVNLENALKNDTAEKVLLDKILETPPMIPNLSEPPTPLITNILFGDNIDPDIDTTQEVINRLDEPMKKIDNSPQDIDIIDELLNVEDIKGNDDIDFDNSLMDIEEVEDIDEYFNKPLNESDAKDDKDAVKRPSSPVENKYCINNFYCKMCKRQFKNLVALKVHCTKYHNIKIEKPNTKRIRKKYVCDYCGKLFESSRCIVKHLENHQKLKTYECTKCKLTFSSETRMKLHESSHTGQPVKLKSTNPKKKYICSICGIEYSSASNYKVHQRRHMKEFTISCKLCGQGFYRKYDFEVHKRKHTGERPYKCQFCPNRFTRIDTLTNHVKLHTDEKPFSCQFCDARFCKAYDLKFHKKNSKSCFQRQMQMAVNNQSKVLDDITVTKAIVY